LRQFFQRGLVEHATRLARLRGQRADREHADARRRFSAACGRHCLGRDIAE